MNNLLNERIRRLLKYGTKYGKEQTKLILLSILPLLLIIVRPFFIQYLLDDIVANKKVGLLIPVLIAFVLTIILERVASFFVNRYHIVLGNRVLKEEQIHLYEHIQKLPPTYFASTSTGDIIVKILSDLQMLSQSMVLTLPTIIFNLVSLTAYIVVLMSLSIKLTIITFCSIPLYYLSLNFFTQKLRKYSQQERRRYGQVNESLREQIEGVLTIKGLNKLGFFKQIFGKRITQWIEKRDQVYIKKIAVKNVTFFITAVTPVIILGVGGFGVINGAMTLGTLVGFFSYINWIYEPINIINENIIGLQYAEPIASRFFELLDLETEIDQGQFPFPTNQQIAFENVTFAYKNDPVLRDLELKIEPQERIALVGISGAGKSTIAHLISRLASPQQGVINIGGQDLQKIRLDAIRGHIQVVHQHDYLFNMSVIDNIILNDDFPKERVLEVVKIAGVDEFIDQLPDGLKTVVGARGTNLSDGQKQRVCLARALIRQPNVLILDEATSALDASMEERIFYRLRELSHTVILISHRLSTIRQADRIIVLHAGQVLDQGSHPDLLARCPNYSKILSNQLSS